MTPAEQLAKEKKRQRPKRNALPATRNVRWKCLLLQRREELNLSQRDVALHVGLSVSSYFWIENGGDVRLVTVIRICNFFGCQVRDLWPGTVKDESWPSPKPKE